MTNPPLPRKIQAPKRGEKMQFLATADETEDGSLHFDHTMQRNSGFSTAHIHVDQDEVYEILQGTAIYAIDGVEKSAGAGEIVTIPRNTYHVNPWNRDSDVELKIRRKTLPEGGAQLFFVTWFTLVNADLHIKKPQYIMNLLQLSLIGATIPAKTYVSGMPLFLQKIAIPFIGFVARLLGYKVRYPELEDSHNS